MRKLELWANRKLEAYATLSWLYLTCQIEIRNSTLKFININFYEVETCLD